MPQRVHTPMALLAPQDRPREKLERLGAGALGDNELLAVLIGHGTAGASALDLANRLLDAAGGLHGLTRLSPDNLAALPGFGAARASRVQAAVELGRRTLTEPAPVRPQIVSPRDAAALVLPRYGGLPVEQVGVILLDARHRVLRVQTLTSGSTDRSLIVPRDVLRPAISLGASALVLFHNHPSGDPTPTDDDVRLTERIVRAGAVVGVGVLDHLVLADARYCSVRKAGGRAWRV